MTRLRSRFSRPAMQGVAALTAAVLLTSPVSAQKDAVEDTALWQLEGALGVVSSVPWGDGRRGLIVEARAGSGEEPVRLVVAAAYMRELGRGDVRCCGPTPGFTYTREAVVLRVGPEWRTLAIGTGALALDLQYSPMWYHSIRGGSQADFSPPPTRWHRELGAVSVGAAWQWRPYRALSARLGVRTYATVLSVVNGAVPAPQFALTAGVGGW